MQQLAQVCLRLGIGCFGPEKKRNLLAVKVGVAVQDQVGEQRLQTCSVKAGDRFIITADAQSAQQVDMQQGQHGHHAT